MKKRGNLFILAVALLLTLLCCEESSVYFLELKAEGSRSLSINTSDPFYSLSSSFSVDSNEVSILALSPRFNNGRVQCGILLSKTAFYCIANLMRPFFERRIRAIDSIIPKGIIRLDSRSSSVVSYSVNGESFTPYESPIVVEDPTSITLKAGSNDDSPRFVSSSITYSFRHHGE